MGGVIVRAPIFEAFMRGPEHVVELFHGYTYSAHPLACAAALAALDLYRDEDLFARAKKLEPLWGQAAMGLKGLPNVLDIRTLGLTAGIDLAARPDAAGRRAYDAMVKAFHEENLVIRVTGDTVALTPPLIVGESEIADMFERVARVIKAVA
jgi:beta-alanine--pyruvate transaminase